MFDFEEELKLVSIYCQIFQLIWQSRNQLHQHSLPKLTSRKIVTIVHSTSSTIMTQKPTWLLELSKLLNGNHFNSKPNGEAILKRLPHSMHNSLLNCLILHHAYNAMEQERWLINQWIMFILLFVVLLSGSCSCYLRAHLSPAVSHSPSPDFNCYKKLECSKLNLHRLTQSHSVTNS